VLSGFLITSLLLVEKERTDTINIKSFYMRRVLRIWPLYYLTVFLGLFVLPEISYLNIAGETELIRVNFTEKLILYLLDIMSI